MQLQTLRKSLLQRLERNDVQTRELDFLLEYALGLSRSQILSLGETEVREECQIALERLIDRLVAGEPLAYITAHQEFYGYDFVVTPSVLIPRSETERLVEKAISIFSNAVDSKLYSRVVVCDVGTGSGAILLSLLSELSRRYSRAQLRHHLFSGVDISDAALAVASFNAGRLGHEPLVKFRHGDLLSTLDKDLNSDLKDRGHDLARDEMFFLLLSNPPYIADAELLDDSVQNYEPSLALRGGASGMELPERLIEQFWQEANSFSHAEALIEIGHQQSHTVECVAQRIGFDGVEFIEDFHGIRRIALIKR
jgi:release factor glutamine methyltransferase